MRKTFVRLVKFVVHKNKNRLVVLTTNLTNRTNKECVSHSLDLLYSWFIKYNLVSSINDNLWCILSSINDKILIFVMF